MLKTISLWCLLVLPVIAGCQPGGRAVDVVVTDGGVFPAGLAGTWKEGTTGWQITFAPDGSITSATIAMGRIEMKPGRKTEFDTRAGGKGVFEPGRWLVQYSPQQRELMVLIVVEHFYESLDPNNTIEGENTDILTGQISQDGRIWDTQWYTMARYVAMIPQPKEFENNSEPQLRGPVTFTKSD